MECGFEDSTPESGTCAGDLSGDANGVMIRHGWAFKLNGFESIFPHCQLKRVRNSYALALYHDTLPRW